MDKKFEPGTTENIPTPEELAERMRDAAKDDDQECRHYTMDGILLDVLEQLGYGEAVKIFRETPAWYA